MASFQNHCAGNLWLCSPPKCGRDTGGGTENKIKSSKIDKEEEKHLKKCLVDEGFFSPVKLKGVVPMWH